MDFKEGLYLLILLLINWKSVDASTVLADVSTIGKNSLLKGNTGGHEQLCTACEVFTARATTALNENKTQSEILDVLHYACSQLLSLEVQCVLVVDYYSAIFFAGVGKIQPEEFCGKVGLCEEQFIAMAKNDETCTLCRRVVAEILVKLKDPKEQLEEFEMLFKECDKVENYAQECKQLVMNYGPYILINGEKFLEKNDVCASIHACSANQDEAIGVTTLLVHPHDT